jgi:hypothetical protein
VILAALLMVTVAGVTEPKRPCQLYLVMMVRKVLTGEQQTCRNCVRAGE